MMWQQFCTRYSPHRPLWPIRHPPWAQCPLYLVRQCLDKLTFEVNRLVDMLKSNACTMEQHLNILMELAFNLHEDIQVLLHGACI
jgi:hypothetical protein